MKLLEFEFDESEATNNQALLSDKIRQALYAEDDHLFELLDYSNDRIFLEPTLFCYLLSDENKQKKISLIQSLYGYIETEKKPTKINLKSDLFGLVNIPNLGYLKTEKPQDFELDSTEITKLVSKNDFVEGSSIRLCLHPTDQLSLKANVTFNESTEQTLQKNKDSLLDACRFMQTGTKQLWSLIESVTREFVVFSSPSQNSFAGISHHGTAYFNTENKTQTTAFFLDDISHQCGHVLYNALTLDSNRYLKVAKNTLLRDFIANQSDQRVVYGAFHGLFTYTCILYSLDNFLKVRSDKTLVHEVLGRLGFYLNKFHIDLVYMNNSKILTDEGMFFHQQFQKSYDYILEKYTGEIIKLNYINQPYTFQYNLFEGLNPLPKD